MEDELLRTMDVMIDAMQEVRAMLLELVGERDHFHILNMELEERLERTECELEMAKEELEDTGIRLLEMQKKEV